MVELLNRNNLKKIHLFSCGDWHRLWTKTPKHKLTYSIEISPNDRINFSLGYSALDSLPPDYKTGAELIKPMKESQFVHVASELLKKYIQTVWEHFTAEFILQISSVYCRKQL